MGDKAAPEAILQQQIAIVHQSFGDLPVHLEAMIFRLVGVKAEPALADTGSCSTEYNFCTEALTTGRSVLHLGHIAPSLDCIHSGERGILLVVNPTPPIG